MGLVVKEETGFATLRPTKRLYEDFTIYNYCSYPRQ